MLQLFLRAYVGLFVALLLIPLVANLRLDERNPCHPTAWLKASDLGGQLRACHDSFEREFVIGPKLNAARMRWLYRLLGVSGAPEVLVGQQDWLYLYGGVYGNKRSIAREPFAPATLRQWVDNIAAWQTHLAQRNIHLVFMIAPDKHSIYPEHLPWHVRFHKEGPSRVNSLIEALRADSRTRDMHIVEPSAALKAHKADAELFQHADTHWNSLGALAAYQALVRSLQPWYPQIEPFQFDDFELRCQTTSDGDLARILNLTPKDHFRSCDLVWPDSFAQNHSHPLANQTAWYGTDPTAHLPARPIRNLLLWGDSFSTHMLPFVLAHTSQARVLRGAGLYDVDELDLQQPDLVIIEMVERHLYGDVPRAPEAPRGFVFGEGFFQELVDRRLEERWMTQDAVLRLSAEHVRKHRGISIARRIPAEVPASGALSYSLSGQPLRPVPEGHLVIACEDWPDGTDDFTIRLQGENVMVPALTGGNTNDHRELTALLSVTWVD